jgi:hypothetical protein
MTHTTTTSGAAEPDNVTRLPDGSAFAIASFPLPDSHWLYAPREYAEGADEPKELPRPILNHTEHREAVVAAIRYAVRGATMCGKEPDFDPDALVQNAVYALCGPFGGRTTLAEKIALASTPAQPVAPARDLAAVIKGAADKLDAAVHCHPNAVDTLIHEALEILDGDREPDAIRASHGQAPADASAGAVAGPDDIDAIALTRYKVVHSHDSMFHRFAVVAGDGKQQLYLGREAECENMARKLAGAFLDGAFYQSNIAPTPAAQAADSVQEDAARYRWLREGNDANHGAAWHVAVNLYGCEWDAAIDAAMNKGATP